MSVQSQEGLSQLIRNISGDHSLLPLLLGGDVARKSVEVYAD